MLLWGAARGAIPGLPGSGGSFLADLSNRAGAERSTMRSMRALLALAGLGASLALAADVRPSDFTWRAMLDTADHAGLLRVPLGGEALAHLQSRELADLRVFDARGDAVPFALPEPPRAAEAQHPQTAAFHALPLYAAQPGVRPPTGVVQLQAEGQQSAWVRLDDAAGAPAPATQRLPAALFDTRAQQQPLTGLVVQARLPDNVPVRVTLATSPDLARWTPAPAEGRLYRFAGPGAPANDRLEFAAPLELQGRYLRLDWSGQREVEIDAVSGLLPAPQGRRDAPASELEQPFADGVAALEWELPFATPIARLALTTAQRNTLLPLRVLGRNQRSDPWRVLGQTLVYRLPGTGEDSTNPPLALADGAVRWLRVEATHGTHLQGVPLAARVEFEPRDLVFVAGGAGPYQMVAGRDNTPAAALPLAMLAAAVPGDIASLPAARITASRTRRPVPGWWTRWLPRGVDARSVGLWLVLAVGLLVLGGVAWSLLRQARQPRQG